VAAGASVAVEASVAAGASVVVAAGACVAGASVADGADGAPQAERAILANTKTDTIENRNLVFITLSPLNFFADDQSTDKTHTFLPSHLLTKLDTTSPSYTTTLYLTGTESQSAISE
jgi:hypothetical protein